MKDTRSTTEMTDDDDEFPEERLHLWRIARAMHRSRYAILLFMLAVALLYAIAAAIALLANPSARIATLPFRLEFQGADRGLYPNATKFSSGEIVATPVLMRVYAANGLQRFISFKEFSESLFVVESNRALEELNREYQARLADPKLTSIDRERIESDFRQKRESLSRNEYALTWTSDGAQLPKSVVAKVLNDILTTWADVVSKEKGVLRYQLPVVSANVLRRDLLNSEADRRTRRVTHQSRHHRAKHSRTRGGSGRHGAARRSEERLSSRNSPWLSRHHAFSCPAPPPATPRCCGAIHRSRRTSSNPNSPTTSGRPKLRGSERKPSDGRWKRTLSKWINRGRDLDPLERRAARLSCHSSAIRSSTG